MSELLALVLTHAFCAPIAAWNSECAAWLAEIFKRLRALQGPGPPCSSPLGEEELFTEMLDRFVCISKSGFCSRASGGSAPPGLRFCPAWWQGPSVMRTMFGVVVVLRRLAQVRKARFVRGELAQSLSGPASQLDPWTS